MNPDVGRQMRGREYRYREPASDVLFADRKGFFGKPNKRIEDGAPSDPLIVERVVEMVGADRVFGEDQRALDGIPDGDANEPGAIVQAAVPGDYRAGRGNMRLRFTTRFLGGVEGTIEDSYAVLGIRLIAIGSIRN